MNVVTMFVLLAHFQTVARPENIRLPRGAQNAVTLVTPVLIAADIKKNQAVVIVAPHVLAAVKHAMIVPY